MANFLSCLDDRLPPGEVQDYLNKIPYPGVKAVLDNAIMPLNERAKQGVRPNPDNQKAGQEVTVGARPAMHTSGTPIEKGSCTTAYCKPCLHSKYVLTDSNVLLMLYT